MSEAGEIAPASGPTVAAPQAFVRDATTGCFVATDGKGRSPAERQEIAERRAAVEQLLPVMTDAEIGAALGWSPATIAKDALVLGLERRRPGARRKHPDADPRVCLNPDCPRGGKPFPPPNWAPDQRYCSIPCARRDATPLVRETARKLKTDSRRRADAEIARLNAAGYLTSRQLARERKVTEGAVSSWIARGLLTANRRLIENEPHRIIAREEFERFNREEWPRIVGRMGPNFPSNWHGPRRRVWSQRLRAPDVGQLGGPRPKYDAEQARLAHTFAAAGVGGRVVIARLVSKSTGRSLSADQVPGILRKPPP
jgi:hypothetical protein